MARNKYPEETISKILKVTAELFMEKGYDKTSMQDIVNRLGMSKGAIYHHFKSKEDLLDKLTTQYFSNIDWFFDIINDTEMNGLEKLRAIFYHELDNSEKVKLDIVTRPRLLDPKILAEQLHASIEQTAPLLAKVIEQGTQDGSLHASYPKEAAELLIISINIWINPGVAPCSKKDFMQKALYLKFLMDASGIPIFDDSLMSVCEKYYDNAVGNL